MCTIIYLCKIISINQSLILFTCKAQCRLSEKLAGTNHQQININKFTEQPFVARIGMNKRFAFDRFRSVVGWLVCLFSFSMQVIYILLCSPTRILFYVNGTARDSGQRWLYKRAR